MLIELHKSNVSLNASNRKPRNLKMLKQWSQMSWRWISMLWKHMSIGLQKSKIRRHMLNRWSMWYSSKMLFDGQLTIRKSWLYMPDWMSWWSQYKSITKRRTIVGESRWFLEARNFLNDYCRNNPGKRPYNFCYNRPPLLCKII